MADAAELATALAAREQQVAELRAQLSGLTARAEQAEVAAELHIGEAAAHDARADTAIAEALAQRERAEARELELANVHAALNEAEQRIAEIEASPSYRLALRLRRRLRLR